MKRIIISIISSFLLFSVVFAVSIFSAKETDALFMANIEALTQYENPGEWSEDKYAMIITHCQHINTGCIVPCLGEIVYCTHPGTLDTCTPHGCLKNHY